MSAGTRVPADAARRLGEAVADLLDGYAVRVMIGGSLRRGRTEVADVELVALCRFENRPAPGQGSLFVAPQPVRVNLTHARVDQLVELSHESGDLDWTPPRSSTGTHVVLRKGDKWGEKYRQLRGDYFEREHGGEGWPLPVDLFLCHEPNAWGWHSVGRTGPTDHNLFLVQRLRDRGITSEGGELRRGGQPYPAPDESTLYAAAGLCFIPPAERSLRDRESPYAAARRWAVEWSP